MDPEQSGIPQIFGSNDYCTSVLLTNQWLLTAKHCGIFMGKGADSLNPYTVYMGTQQTWLDDFKTDDGFPPDTSHDLAIGLLHDKLIMNGSTDNYIMPIYPAASSTLAGQSVDGYGYGKYCLGDKGTGMQRQILRSALGLPVVQVDAGLLLMAPNSQNQLQSKGDSGGPAFYKKTNDGQSGLSIAGILTGRTEDNLSTSSADSDNIKLFIQGVVPGF